MPAESGTSVLYAPYGNIGYPAAHTLLSRRGCAVVRKQGLGRTMRRFRRNISQLVRTTLVLSALTGLLSAAHAASGISLQGSSGNFLNNGSRLVIETGSNTNGFTTADADRVDFISWINSDGATVSNYVAVGGPLHCGDPQEFFGEAYGDSSDSGVPLPLAVIGGVTSVWSSKIATVLLKGTATVQSLASCDTTLDAKTTTHYQVFTSAALISSLKIARTFKFSKHPADGNLRAYVPRLPLSIYPVVLAPNAAGVVQTYQAGNCPVNCSVTDWNGKWMADDDGNGNGMAIFRDPATDPPAQLTIDWDGFSSSNNSAVTLVEPAGGWGGKTVTETEYLCFYDAKSWTAKKRKAGLPPVGCGKVPH